MLNRRDFLKAMGGGAAAMTFAGCATGPGARWGRKNRPNVIIVMTDDQGYGDFSCHGNPVLKTPNMDKLHSQSVRLTDFHVAPIGAATRGQLMSGLDALRNKVRQVCAGLDMMRTDVPTMADIFKASGYRTGLFGKWHLGDTYPYLPQNRGFEEALYFKSWGLASVAHYWGSDYFDDMLYHNGELKKYEGYCNDVWFGEATKWMKGRAGEGRPFYCHLATNLPHAPLLVPEKYAEPYAEHGGRSLYFGMIACADEATGKLMQMLEDSGLADNTIVIFMTDNGGFNGVPVFDGGMRGTERTYYEGGHRGACFIRWPKGRLVHGSDIDGLTTCQDLLPTLIELCDLRAPAGAKFDGVSIAGLLRGSAEKLAERMIVVQCGTEATKWESAVMWGKWRLVKGVELYNIAEDPGQMQDVADANPDICTAMRKHYEKWYAEVEPIANEPCYVHIGSEHENPVDLTCAQWYMTYADALIDLRGGNNSYWNILVERDGEYEFTLSRYPIEADTAMNRPVTIRKTPMPGLEVGSARLTIGQFDDEQLVEDGDKWVSFKVRLKAGKRRLQTWFSGKHGYDLGGACFVRVTRVG